MHKTLSLILFIGAIVFFSMAAFAGAIDTEAGVTGLLVAQGAAVDLKTIEAAMKKAFDSMGGRIKDLEAMMLEIAQRGGSVPQSGSGGGYGELTRLVAESEGLKQFLAGNTPLCRITVPKGLVVRNAIINPAPGESDPLRQPDRSRGIVAPPQQRLTIRALFEQVPTTQGSIDIIQEATFTNNAATQGTASSPTGSGEAEVKAESQMTFTASTLQIPTIAHRIEASKQVLSDAPRLRGHLEGRMLYGLLLEEEAQMLTGDGTQLNMDGLNNQATAFSGGATNATQLDTLARAINQLQVANFEPGGLILHPTDWLAIKLLKDSQNRYLLGDPAALTMPSLWGLPVIPTPSQTVDRFTVLDARQAGYIADREDATVTIGLVNDQFIRNMVTILAEERALIVVERPTAIVYGDLTTPG